MYQTKTENHIYTMIRHQMPTNDLQDSDFKQAHTSCGGVKHVRGHPILTLTRNIQYTNKVIQKANDKQT